MIKVKLLRDVMIKGQTFKAGEEKFITKENPNYGWFLPRSHSDLSEGEWIKPMVDAEKVKPDDYSQDIKDLHKEGFELCRAKVLAGIKMLKKKFKKDDPQLDAIAKLESWIVEDMEGSDEE